MNDNNNKDASFNLSLGDFNLNLNVNISSNNLITETEHKYEKKQTDYLEHLNTEKFTEIFENDFEFQEKSSHVTPKKVNDRLRETARFPNQDKLEKIEEKCEFRKNFPLNIRNSIKENIFVEADSGEDQTTIISTETYNKPKLNKIVSTNMHSNRFTLKKKQAKNRNRSVAIAEGNYSSSNNSGKLGFEILPFEEFNFNVPKLGSTKHIGSKIIKKNKTQVEEKNDDIFREDVSPPKENYVKRNRNNIAKYESYKNDSNHINTSITEQTQSPISKKKKFGSQQDIPEIKNIQKKIYSPLKSTEQDSPQRVKREKKKSIDFNKRNHFNQEDMSNTNIINKESNDVTIESKEEIELECHSEQIMDFKKSFNKNSDLLKFFSDLRNLKYLEEFIKSKMYLNKEIEYENSKNYKEEYEKILEEREKQEESYQELKKKYDKKHRDFIEVKSKYDNIVFDNEILERKITVNNFLNKELRSQIKNSNDSSNESNLNNLKSQIKEKEENIIFLQDEIVTLNGTIENLKNELNSLKNDSIKSLKQNDLQTKLHKLEEENSNFKNKLNTKMNDVKETKKQLEHIKETNSELKSQNEALNNKYQTLMEDSYMMKKEILNYEKEIKIKNETISKLSIEIESIKQKYDRDRDYPSNSRGIYDSPIKENNNKKAINFQKKKMNMDTIEESLPQSHGNNFSNFKNSILCDSGESGQIRKNNSNSTNVQSSNGSNFDNSSLSSMKQNNNELKQSDKSKKAQNAKNEYLKNEAKIIEIEKKLITLQKNKEQIISDISKMPEFPKQKVQILKKKSLEHTLNEYNAEINTLKSELRGLNSIQREF